MPQPSINLEFLKPPTDTKIPIPSPAHLEDTLKPIPGRVDKERKLDKYEKEFDAFCQWAALPKDVRKPKKLVEFEKKWNLPKNYTQYFRQREDYQEKRYRYFYEWMMDLYPDLVHQAYKRAMRESTADFKVLTDIITKTMDVSKPQVNVQPMMIVGVPQEKIDKLFTPKEYEKVTPLAEVK